MDISIKQNLKLDLLNLNELTHKHINWIYKLLKSNFNDKLNSMELLLQARNQAPINIKLLGRVLTKKCFLLKKLGLTLHADYMQNGSILTPLLRPLKRNALGLKDLKLSFDKDFTIEDRHLAFLTKGLNRSTRLKNLEIVINEFYGISDRILSAFCKSIHASNGTLESLAIRSNHQLYIREKITLLMKYVGELLFMGFFELKNFILDFSSKMKVNSTYMQTIGEALEIGVPNLKTLKLLFNGFTESSKGINVLSKSISKLHFTLENLGLQLRGAQDQDLTYFSQIFVVEFPRLHQLSLDFSESNDLSAAGLKSLGKSLESTGKDLKSLEINFSFCPKLTAENIEEFVKNFQKNTKMLKKFNLKYKTLSGSSSTSLKEINSIITNNIGTIEQLAISHYDKQTEMKNSFYNIVSNSSLNRPSNKIKSLNLHFNIAKAGDKGMEAFSVMLKTGFKELESLKLKFNSKSEQTDAYMKMLGEALSKRNHKISSLYLDFTELEELTDTGSYQFVESIKAIISALDDFVLLLPSKNYITKNGIQNVDMLLRKWTARDQGIERSRADNWRFYKWIV